MKQQAVFRLFRFCKISAASFILSIFLGGNTTAYAVFPSIPGVPYSWGQNDLGQLGDGTTTDQPSPAPRTGLSAATELAATMDGSLALLPGGSVAVWGDNNECSSPGLPCPSQGYSVSPVQIQNFSGIRKIGAGWFHWFALDEAGGLWTWGNNSDGQLGDGTQNYRNTPVKVNLPRSVSSFTGGQTHSLALLDDGTIRAWGSNSRGQLGNGGSNSSSPVLAAFVPNVSSVSAGIFFSLALTSDGHVWSWGENVFGQLGIGTQDYDAHPVPMRVIDPSDPTGFLTRVKAVAGGGWHTVALKDDGTVWSWGQNNFGQLGIGMQDYGPHSLPEQVKDPDDPTGFLTGIVAVSAKCFRTVALKADGTVYVWGMNGTPWKTDNEIFNLPSQVPNLFEVTAIAAGMQHTLALVGGTLPPSSHITDPTSGQSIAGNEYQIYGTSSDPSGPGISYVEVSTDGGITWKWANGTFPWSYSWDIPAVEGFVTIKSRAVSSDGRMESPGPGVVVTVDNRGPIALPQITNAFAWGTDADNEVGDMCIDGEDNVIVVGDTAGNLGGPNTGAKDMFITKFGPDGSILWNRQRGSTGWEWTEGVGTDTEGNIYVAGKTSGGLDGYPDTGDEYYDMFIMKYDRSGNWKWTRQIGGKGADQLDDACVDPSGNVYATGFTDNGPSTIWGDTFVYKYDTSGNVVWKYFPISPGAYLSNVAVDDVGNAYAAGNVNRPFDGQPYVGGQSDIVLVKLNPSGGKVWTRLFGGSDIDEAGGVKTDAAGNVYVCGWTRGGFDGYPLSIDPYSMKMFLTKFDSNGNRLWTRMLGDERPDRFAIYAQGVTTDANGDAYVGGWGTGRINGEDGNGSFVAKYSAAGDMQWVIRTSNNFWNYARSHPAINGKGDIFQASHLSSGSLNNLVLIQISQGGFEINGGAETAASPDVTLNIDAKDFSGVAKMQISNDGTFDTAPWVEYASSTLWTLQPGGGTRTVYARFMDSLGNISPIHHDSIFVVNTPAGPDVHLDQAALSAPIDITFSSVTQPGQTTVTTGTSGPEPPVGFRLASLYYEISTTASFAGPVQVCFYYDETAIGDESALRLYHYSGVEWQDITGSLDTTNNRICGQTTQFSPFALMVPDNRPPKADAGPNQLVECTSAGGAEVTLDGTGSSDPDGDVLSYTWSWDGGSVTGAKATIRLALGTHAVVLGVSDAKGGTATDTVEITVRDTTPPVVIPPADIVMTAVDALTAVNIGVATASDAGGAVTLTNDAPTMFPMGTTVVRWTATDTSGNLGQAVQRVSLHYDFEGFLPPVGGAQKPFKTGTAVPVKFSLTYAGGSFAAKKVAFIKLQKYSDNKPDMEPIVAGSVSGADTGNQFRYDETNNIYIFNLSTMGLASGSWEIQAYLDDETVHSAMIALRE